MADTNPIKIFKGDDTDFNNSKFLSIKINTEMDLTGFKGIFKLGKFKTEQDMQSKTMEIVIPHEVTALMLNGTHTGIFTLIDTKNRVKTLSNTIPFLVTSEVFTQEEDSIDLPVPEGYPYEIIVELGSASDYNSLQNIPTFEGQPIKGNLTFQSTGIAPLESLDALVQVVNQKANTVDVQNACGQLQEQITTNKNDIDGLGDQVAGIEAKIPETATAENQLVTKEQMDDAIANAGSSVDLTGYYNRDNLLGADEIEIVPEPVEGGIDNHTLACWHFDNSLLDEVSQLSIRNTNTAIFVTGKFGMAVGALYGGRPDSNLLLKKVLDVLNDWTIDCDVVINGSSTNGLQLYVGGEHSDSQLSAGYSPFTGSCSLYKYGTKLISTTIEKISAGEKPHFAFQKKGNNAQIFINGKKVIDYDLSSYTLSSSKGFKTTGGSAVSIDELRISDIARYTEDFEPPTKPYSVAVPTGNYVVRNKTKLVHKSDIGVANGVASLDTNGKVLTEQIPVATASSLGGVKLEFDETTGTLNIKTE